MIMEMKFFEKKYFVIIMFYKFNLAIISSFITDYERPRYW